jgi:CheY-like chemotaxis protein
VIRGRVLVIEGDEWIAPVLAGALKERGFTVEVCAEARAGFAKACEATPDCVICSFELPDIDGFWVVRRIRTEAGSLSQTPIIMFGEVTEKTARMQAFAAGADMVLARPMANEDVVMQVEALIAMARRFEPDDAPQSSRTVAAAIRGDLSMFPLASVLMMFELERRSGVIDVVSSGGTRAVLTIAHGLFAQTELDGDAKPAVEVLRAILSWRAGRFSFVSRDPDVMPPPRDSVGALVLEAMRLEDEKRNGGEPAPRPFDPTDPFASLPPPAPGKRASIAPGKRASIAPGKRASIAPGKRASMAPPKPKSKPPAKAPSAPKPPALPKKPLPPKAP